MRRCYVNHRYPRQRAGKWIVCSTHHSVKIVIWNFSNINFQLKQQANRIQFANGFQWSVFAMAKISKISTLIPELYLSTHSIQREWCEKFDEFHSSFRVNRANFTLMCVFCELWTRGLKIQIAFTYISATRSQFRADLKRMLDFRLKTFTHSSYIFIGAENH